MEYGDAIVLGFWYHFMWVHRCILWMGGWETGRPDVGKAFNYKEVYF